MTGSGGRRLEDEQPRPEVAAGRGLVPARVEEQARRHEVVAAADERVRPGDRVVAGRPDATRGTSGVRVEAAEPQPIGARARAG